MAGFAQVQEQALGPGWRRVAKIDEPLGFSFGGAGVGYRLGRSIEVLSSAAEVPGAELRACRLGR